MKLLITTETYSLDTNVQIAVHDLQFPDRNDIAQALISQPYHCSAQLVSEYINVLKRIYRVGKAKLLAEVLANLEFATIHPVTKDTLLLADRLRARYDFQIFDAIIVANALEADCTVFYTEDMQHNQLIEGRLRIINPFL